MRRILILPLALAICTINGAAAHAQVTEPIGPFAADVRVAWARFAEDAAIASALGVSATNLPTRGLGLVFGAHWYPLRLGGVTLGLGGELLTARASRTLAPAAPGGAEGPTVETRLSVASPQISLNFGKKDGWSYLSGGIGWAGFTAERTDQPLADGSRTRTINYGGGARWFTGKHLAVSVDLRFYAIGAQPAVTGRPAFPKTRRMVISGGIALR